MNSAPITFRQTGNLDAQLGQFVQAEEDKIKAEFEDKLKSLIPRVEARQTSNALQQLIDEIKSEFEAKLKSLIPRVEARQTSNAAQ
jgi:hypothetical protein